MAGIGRRQPPLLFSKQLVLNQWLLGFFGVRRFDDLAHHLRDESLEGLDEDNVHRFHRALYLHLPADRRPNLSDDDLLAYDQSITSVTAQLNERRITRGLRPISWKYFQYLALLFTEIYLDWYFKRPQEMLEALNEQIAQFNASVPKLDRVERLDEAADARQQLNKVAFWMATGSGKTLLMHAHMLRYLELLRDSQTKVRNRAHDLNRIILLTPNEGLSHQHLREFETAGIPARIFDKNAPGLFTGQTVDILEVTKLKDEMGDKTVAVDAFEGNNLVLVDEGHRGTATVGTRNGGTWMDFRKRLCEKGFSFEYSATFGQAVRGKNRKKLADLYARSTLFDYSYRWFYGDGFGKDYRILNLEDDRDAEWQAGYLTACLLVFFQQQRLYREQESTLRCFNLERPLWVFVGGSVTKTLSQREASDVVTILRFLADYVSDRTTSIHRIREILKHGFGDGGGSAFAGRSGQQDMFTGRLAHLHESGLSPEGVFDETLEVLFHAPNGGTLHVENLKGAAGEVALRVGDNDPFAVVNVGDDAQLVKLCDQHGFAVAEREFGGSLFHGLDNAESTVNLLIGSRKFTEGWNSWRVSTMGLMYIGRSEGAQIIQLFGRGVRLKGRDMSLKRSGRAKLPEGLKRPDFIETLETLHVFGIRANYMAQFRDFLTNEGLAVDNEQVEIPLPVVENLGKETLKLKTVRLKKVINGVNIESGDAFRKLGPMPVLRSLASMESNDRARKHLHKRVVLDWYPKIKAMKSEELSDVEVVPEKHEAKLEELHTAFLDLDRIYSELDRFKSERNWHNLSVSRTAIRELLNDDAWYRLLIPESQMIADSFDKVQLWDQIALALLKKYVERYYTFRKNDWERRHLEYREVTAADANFPMIREKSGEYGYRIAVDKSKEEIVAKLEKLKAQIERGDLKPWAFQGLRALSFDRHLYTPLLALDGAGIAEITPVPLNMGERRFVEDLKTYCEGNPRFLEGKELYLLRNLSRGRGIGFFEAGNFHPDFILWLLTDGRQYVTFVDPKGLVQQGVNNEKIEFYKTIKGIEKRLDDPAIVLNSYIVSVSSSQDVKKRWGYNKSWLTERNVVFQKEDRDSYIGAILSRVVGDDGSG